MTFFSICYGGCVKCYNLGSPAILSILSNLFFKNSDNSAHRSYRLYYSRSYYRRGSGAKVYTTLQKCQPYRVFNVYYGSRALFIIILRALCAFFAFSAVRSERSSCMVAERSRSTVAERSRSTVAERSRSITHSSFSFLLLIP